MHTIKTCKILLLAGTTWIFFVIFLDHHWERVIEKERTAESLKNQNELADLHVKEIIREEVQRELKKIEVNNNEILKNHELEKFNVQKRFEDIQKLIEINQELVKNQSLAMMKFSSSHESLIKLKNEVLVPQEIPAPPSLVISSEKTSTTSIEKTSKRKSWQDIVTPIPPEVLNKLAFSSRGENGQGVYIPNASPEIQQKIDAGWSAHQFNEFVSDIISPNRSVPDPRSQYCLRQNYLQNLPKTSVIIIFHNEAWSTLLRSVHSVLNRSPEHLIEEIILVDDASTMGE